MSRLIDADALRAAVMKILNNSIGGAYDGVYQCLEAINNAPTVLHDNYSMGYQDGVRKVLSERPQGEWIPVSERLPEGKIDPMTNDFELVLCSTFWGIVRPYKFGKPIGHDKAHFWSGAGVMDDYVIAWMPLPEAYKEAENE